MNKTYIHGKDASLEDSIARMQHTLSQHGFNIIENRWGNPAPNVWWVNIHAENCPMCFTNGKGSTKKAALASALGEFIERLASNYFFADFYWGKSIADASFAHYPDEKWFELDSDNCQQPLSTYCPEGLLDSRLCEYFDPDGELYLNHLIDINAANTARGVCAIPFIRQHDEKIIYFPVNIVANLYVSNGMAAGNTKTEARTQALSEILERYIKNKIIAEGIALPEIDSAVLAHHSSIFSVIETLNAEGYLIHVLDASLGGQFPVVCITLLNRENGGCFASFGAHPNFAVALERTITELLQGRALQDMQHFSAPVFDIELVADPHNLETHFIDSSGLVSWDLFRQEKTFPFTSWNHADNTSNEYAFLMQIFAELNADVYIADYNYLDIYACRIIVPSISEIYPIEELIQYNNNMGIAVRNHIFVLPEHHSEEICEQLLAWIDNCGFDDSALVKEILGIAVEENNPWASLRLGELRCFLLLAIHALEEALDMTQWVLTFGTQTMPAKRQRFFACLLDLLQLSIDDNRDIDDYETIHRAVYGNKTYDAACRHISGKQHFYELTAIHHDLTNLPQHQQLLTLYQKWQKCKHDQNQL